MNSACNKEPNVTPSVGQLTQTGSRHRTMITTLFPQPTQILASLPTSTHYSVICFHETLGILAHVSKTSTQTHADQVHRFTTAGLSEDNSPLQMVSVPQHHTFQSI